MDETMLDENTIEGEVREVDIKTGVITETPPITPTIVSETAPSEPKAEAAQSKPKPKPAKVAGKKMINEGQLSAIKSLLDIRFGTDANDASVVNKWESLYGTGDLAQFTYEQAGAEIERLQKVKKPSE